MLSNRPLFPTLADLDYFVWTDAARAVARGLELGRNTLILGPRGSGKTSILNVVGHRLREAGRPVAFVSLRGIEDAGAAIAAVHRAAVDQGWVPDLAPDEAQALDGDDPFLPTAVLRRLAAAPDGARLLLDDVGSASATVLFGRLRDELWQLGLVWAAASSPEDAGALLTPPADAFFEWRVQLEELSRDERRELLERRAGDELARARIAELAEDGPGNPRELVAFARLAEENGLSPEALAGGAERLRRAAEEAAGRAGALLVDGLDGLGPVSAGDPRLLDRLGWDRPRAARTLSRLEDAGLVRSVLEPRNGRNGRPRKLYELLPPAEFAAR